MRVLQTGEVGAGDPIRVVHRPAHGVTVGLAFRACTTERHRLPEPAPAVAVLPDRDRDRDRARVADALPRCATTPA